MKRVTFIVICIMLIFSICATAFADSNMSSRASQVIDETTIAIRFSGGKVYGAGNIKTVATADKVGISAMALYEENASGGWTRIASASSKYGYNTNDYSHTISAAATAGKEYKLVVSFYGKIGSLTDTLTKTKYSTY